MQGQRWLDPLSAGGVIFSERGQDPGDQSTCASRVAWNGKGKLVMPRVGSGRAAAWKRPKDAQGARAPKARSSPAPDQHLTLVSSCFVAHPL